MGNEELIARLRAALSWELAPSASNPAFQAFLEMQRDRDPLHINQLGVHGKYAELFKDGQK